MLHLVRHSPLSQLMLQECLLLMGAEDKLLLLQDGVIATTLPDWLPALRLLDGRLYVLAEDLLARGLTPKVGQVIDIGGFVDLVAETAPETLFIIQPVTPFGGCQAASPEQILRCQDYALSRLADVRVIPQTHKMIGQI